MASLKEVLPSSGNTSQDSKGSGGQKSMLELLSITDAAVKALNKSTRSQSSTGSQGSRKSHNSDPLVQSTHSDRSVKSECSDQTVKSTHSGHSVQSGRSGLSARSHLSGQSQRSHQSGHSREDNSDDRMLKPIQTEKDTSYDSGVISKTHTISEEKNKQRGVSHGVLPADGGLHERSSDESTTASDILIRSTIDKSERSFNGNGLNGNSSITSKCSKTSYGAENFNSSGPQKVKISKKHLREIKSPFEEESPRDSVSSDGKVPSALFGVNSKSNSNSDGSQHSGSGSKVERKISPRDSLQRSNMESNQAKNGGKSFPRGIDSDQFKVEKVRKSAEKPYEDVNMVKTKPKIGGHVQQTSKNKENDSMKPSKKLDNGIKVVNGVLGSHGAEPVGQARSTPKYFVERHTPQKSQPKVGGSVYPLGIPEKKNLLQDLEDSVEIVTTHAKDTSNASSSQPEIVTIPERIVTVSAKMSLSPTSSISDFVVSKATAPTVTFHSAAHRLRDDKGPAKDEKEKNLDDSNVIPPALSRRLLDDDGADDDLKKQDIQARSQWFSRQVNGHGLQQGAPVSGHEAPDRPKDVDVHISDYKLSNKQKSAKEMFARRQGGPVRRIVQPRLVGHDSKASSTSSTGDCKPQQQLGQSNNQVLTAAAAASAAVAATQPFLKAQHEMETKMAEVLTKINELQSGDVTSKPSVTSGADLERVQQLERQVADMTERRIEYMEAMQAQQMAMQAKLLSMTRETSTGSRSHTHQPRSHSPESHVHRHDMSTTSSVTHNGKKAFSKTTIHKPPIKGEYHSNFHKYSALDAEQSASQLDTPNPRARAPRPTIYDTSEIEFKARSRSPKAKSPKARSPVLRPRSRSPTKESQDRGILHQILASSVSPEPGYPRERTHILQTRHSNNKVPNLPC